MKAGKSHWTFRRNMTSLFIVSPLFLSIELEKETFKTLWELSAEGSPAQRCFIRAKQTEYYTIEREDPDYLSFMPDVSLPIVSAFWLISCSCVIV